MASVAAAIEEASAAKVDQDLWWDSHTQLFQAVDKSISNDTAFSSSEERQGSPDDDSQQRLRRDTLLAEKLRVNHRWLLYTLSHFKPPSASSRAALNFSRVAVGNHILEIKSTMRDVALQVSKDLVLDEIQAYILSSRVCESVHSTPIDSVLLSTIMLSYYMERQSLLKTTRLLLTCQMAEEDTPARSLQAISEEVARLLNDGLEDKLVEVLKESINSPQPQHLNRQSADLWAEEAALEHTLLLDNIFLLYYEPLCVCKLTRLKELLIIFEDLAVGGNRNEILALTPEVEKSLRHARHQGVLIIIEALDLESLLLMVHSETPFSQGGYALSVDELQQLDAVMAGLDLGRAPEYGPILLSWATFLCLVSFLPLMDGQSVLAEVEHTGYVRQAYDAGAYNFLRDMLRDEYFQESDIQVGGYKSVIKTLMAAFLAAYDFASQMSLDGHDILIDILTEIYRGQEALCSELWDRDSIIDGPIRNVLFSLRDLFPYQTLSLVRLLAAQCEGTWPAECVYDFLYKMVDITCLYQHDELSLMDETGSRVRTRIALQVPDAPGLLIPAGTSGYILKELTGSVCLVRWECRHSGMVVLLLRMLQRASSSYQSDEVLAILELINRMLSSNKVLTQLLLDLDVATATVTARSDGRMESSLRLDVVSMVCSVINALVQTTGEDVMVASCIGILSSFSLCCPERVMTELCQSILLQPSGSYLSFSDGGAFPGTLLHELIVKTEQSSGHYPLTISVLDLCKTMVEKGVVAEPLVSLLMHVVGNLFVNHGHWKYRHWHERWIITTKVLQVLRIIVTGVMRTKEVGPLKRVLELLLYDCIIHDVLINILSINAQELEELHFNRSVGIKEIEWLQQALYSVLMLLHDLILDVSIGVCSKEYGGMTLLEQTLFRKSAGVLPVVTAIASFLSFSRNGDLQFASAKVLTSLFLLAQKSRPHPCSIASYLSSNDQRLVLRAAVGELLSEETAFSNSLLFEATIDLLTGAVKWQPALVELLLFPEEQSEAVAKISDRKGAEPSTGPNGTTSVKPETVSEGLDALWKFITNSAALGRSHPQLLSQVLFLLASIWEGGIEYLQVIEALRTRSYFWKLLTSCVSFSDLSSVTPPTLLSKIRTLVDTNRSIVSTLNKSQLVEFSLRYSCEASVLSIMARDIFLQQHLVQIGSHELKSARASDPTSDDREINTASINVASKMQHTPPVSGALQIVSEWSKSMNMNSIMSSYASSLYDKDVLLRAKAEARLLIVGLMGKNLSGESRGLNVSLSRRIREAAKQINQHPSFEELFEQYFTRGYSYGERLQIMLVSDLFHHLQGELDGGRPIPSGYFQHVADFLVSSEVDSLLNPTVATQLPDLHPRYGDVFMYDTGALEAELGLEWWPHADFGIVTAYVAESTLTWIKNSNAIACLGHSQLSALRSWTSLLSVSIFNKHEADTGQMFVAADWTEVKLQSYASGLCEALEGILIAIGPLGDPTNFTPSFMRSQVQLLLVFIRWLPRLGSSTSQNIHVWAVCAQLIRTVVNCLKKLLDAKCFMHQQVTELLKTLLGALLLLLELMHSHKSGLDGASSQEIGDAFADVTLVGLGVLPALCHAAEKKEYANLSLALINVIMKSFLAPSTWFPLLQDHFPLELSLSRMHENSLGPHFSKVMLNFCLSFARLKTGAELLHSAGVFSHLQMLTDHFEEMSYTSTDKDGPFCVWQKNVKQHEGLWSIGVAVVTGMIRSLADKDPRGVVLQNALTYIQFQKDRLIGALRAPVPSMDLQGRKKAKLRQPSTTLTALQETQHVVALMCEVSRHHAQWTAIFQDSISDFGELLVHLLAFIAREGMVRPGSSIRSGTGTGFSCHPVQKHEIYAHTRPSVVSSSFAWFAVAARGCAVGEISQSRSQSPTRIPSQSRNLSPGRKHLSPTSVSNTVASGIVSEYSDMVAIQIYKLALLLLRFLCQQAYHAIRRVEGGPPDYSHFPELPAPEILHGLQDQVVTVVTDICGKAQSKPAQEVCHLLLSIMEMTLYLEVCIAKTCSMGSLPLRSDDFGKEYKAMLLAGAPHKFLEVPFQSLKRIMATAHPGLLFCEQF